MKIKTEFNIGDKVWYYLEGLNQYAWGKVLCIETKTNSFGTESFYHIENRFYNPKMWYGVVRDYKDYRLDAMFHFKENEVFSESDDVKDHVSIKYQKQLDDMTELKKGLFS